MSLPFHKQVHTVELPRCSIPFQHNGGGSTIFTNWGPPFEKTNMGEKPGCLHFPIDSSTRLRFTSFPSFGLGGAVDQVFVADGTGANEPNKLLVDPDC